jgi:hypothetical protein
MAGARGNPMASLWWGMLFGAIGMGYCVYGKRQSKPIPLLCGIGLIAFPWFVSNPWIMVIVGAALMAIPRFIRI